MSGMNPNPTGHQARAETLDAAQRGNPNAAWTVYTHFERYARTFHLTPGTQHDLLLQAMQAGHPEAQFEVAKLLRGGWITLPYGLEGGAGRQRRAIQVTDRQPSQADLDAAHALLTRAAAHGHDRASTMLSNLGAPDWDARTAQRSAFGTHAQLLRDARKQAEDEELEAARTARPNWLSTVLLLVALGALLWGAWALYNARLTQKQMLGMISPPLPATMLYRPTPIES